MEKIKFGNFNVIIHNENWLYWAEVEDLPGCFTQAETKQELFKNLKEAIASYIISLQKDLIFSDFNQKQEKYA